MADAIIDLKLVDTVHLDYVDGAELGFDAFLRPLWDALVVQFPSLTLNRVFTSMSTDAIADVMDAIRMQGSEPPNVLNLFSAPCPPDQVDIIVSALEQTPFVEWAQQRREGRPPSLVHYGDEPLSKNAFHLRSPPNGIDAIYAWSVAGGDGLNVGFCDIENGWLLNHDDLVDAHVNRFSVFGSPDVDAVDHGTGALGIVLASDNGTGSVGVVPRCRASVVSTLRANGEENVADALFQAGFAAGVGGVALLEHALPFTEVSAPDIPSEFDFKTQIMIRLLALFGVTVIEPAGNRPVDLDAFPFLAHLQRGNPKFVESYAVMVGASEPNTLNRAHFSAHGSRVDCFAPGWGIRAPSSSVPPPGHSYTLNYNGTSGASAIIAGAAVAIQGMALAHSGAPLGVIDVRRLLSDPNLNVLSANSTAANPNADGIGVLPDLRAIARHQSWARIVPPAASPTDIDIVEVVSVDDFDRLFSHQWQRPIGTWSVPLFRGDAPTPPEQIAIVSRIEPILGRIITDAFSVGVDREIQYMWWDTVGQDGELWKAKSLGANLSPSEPLAVAFSSDTQVDIVAFGSNERLMATRAVVDLHPQSFGPVAELDILASFSGSAGPSMVSRGPGLLDVIAIDTRGQLRWTSVSPESMGQWDVLRPIGGNATRLARSVRPGLANRGTALAMIAIGIDELLYAATKPDPPTLGWGDLRQIGGSLRLAIEGPIALVSRDPQHLDAFVIDTDGRLNWTWWQAIPFIDWVELELIGGTEFKLSPLGGVTAVSRTPDSIDVFAVDVGGRIVWTQWIAGQDWTPLTPVWM